MAFSWGACMTRAPRPYNGKPSMWRSLRGPERTLRQRALEPRRERANGLRILRTDGIPRARHAAAPGLRRARRAGAPGRCDGARDRMVRGASLLELLHLPLAPHHGRALRRGNGTDQPRARGHRHAALRARPGARRDRDGRLSLRRKARARRRFGLSALRVRTLRRRHHEGAPDARRVPRHAPCRVRVGDVQPRRRALLDAVDPHQRPAGRRRPSHLGRRRQRVRPPDLRAPRLRADVHRALGRGGVPERDARSHRTVPSSSKATRPAARRWGSSASCA